MGGRARGVKYCFCSDPAHQNKPDLNKWQSTALKTGNSSIDFQSGLEIYLLLLLTVLAQDKGFLVEVDK